MHLSPTFSVREQRIKKLKPPVRQEFCDDDKTIFKIHLVSKLRHPHKDKRPYVLANKSYNLSLKCMVCTTATVQFAVNYVPQCFNANASYSVLSRFIITKSMGQTDYMLNITTFQIHYSWLFGVLNPSLAFILSRFHCHMVFL